MNCNIKDTLLKFKIEDKTINLIGSYEDSINVPGIKVTSVQSKIGEVAELQSYLKL